MNTNVTKLNNKVIKCKKCPRLVKFRKKIATKKRKQFINQTYWGKPITGFGDIKGRILFVGLAPAAHGGNRTGRVFTGDRSAEFLYKCLHKAKIALTMLGAVFAFFKFCLFNHENNSTIFWVCPMWLKLSGLI